VRLLTLYLPDYFLYLSLDLSSYFVYFLNSVSLHFFFLSRAALLLALLLTEIGKRGSVVGSAVALLWRCGTLAPPLAGRDFIRLYRSFLCLSYDQSPSSTSLSPRIYLLCCCCHLCHLCRSATDNKGGCQGGRVIIRDSGFLWRRFFFRGRRRRREISSGSSSEEGGA
jgi:hypothetical protein